jgi:hypothetical protein
VALVNVPLGLEVFTLAERPDLESRVDSLPDMFPEFMYHDATVGRYWEGLFTDFAAFQIVVCDRGDEVLAAGHCIPVFWEETAEGLPTGLDGVLEQGVRDPEVGRAPTVVSALLAIVSHAHRGRGLSSVVLTTMKTVAAENGLGALIAPVPRSRNDIRSPRWSATIGGSSPTDYLSTLGSGSTGG